MYTPGAATPGTVIIGICSVIIAALICTGAIQHGRRSGNWLAFGIALGAALLLVAIVFQQVPSTRNLHGLLTTSFNAGIVNLSPTEIAGGFIVLLFVLLVALFEPVRSERDAEDGHAVAGQSRSEGDISDK